MTHRGSILLVDDEEKILKALGRALRDAGHTVTETASARHGQRLLAERTFDVLIVDNIMPELSGLDLIREFVAAVPEHERPQILMMTAHATVESAIEAMKLGALDYLQKPFEIDELLVVVRRALDHQRLRTEYRYLVSERDEQFDHYGIIGRSRAMQEVIRRAELVAGTKSTVLITGETGTGKELVARAIHDRSAQRDMPLIKVNCAAIPETLLESELFGHARGAFSGAVQAHKGLFLAADGGTIFLDEIGDMPLALQVKLLRVLQEGEVRPVGATQSVPVDVRVISATHRDLDAQRTAGEFREDLFYRLNVVSLKLPALAERREDIPLLATHFLRRLAERYKKPVPTLAPDAMALLIAAPWPGNVRQLLNLLEQALALTTTSVIPATLVQGALREDAGMLAPFEEARKQFERDYLVRLLKITGGNVTQAATLAKRNRTEFYKLLQRHRLEPGTFKSSKP